ncbi:hypothetical protein [Pseudorhodobacter aquimaris]|uniref:hypothetical protein n=1 Tax=Pseudorhodobacter aquimaris TaxID=687412 RepID=UPI00067D2613|nr:hypothetical protein [Pseudorhodobacter aquimaris]
MGTRLFWGGFLLVMAVGLAGCLPDRGSEGVVNPAAIQAPAVEVTPLAAAATPKSASHLACLNRGGSYVAAPGSGFMTCQIPTTDGGKQCRRAADCDGVCLARSGTCAPVKPLLGCNAVLQDDGRRVELCID